MSFLILLLSTRSDDYLYPFAPLCRRANPGAGHCPGMASTTYRVVDSLPRLLPVGVEDAAFQFLARNVPRRVTLVEYNNGVGAAP